MWSDNGSTINSLKHQINNPHARDWEIKAPTITIILNIFTYNDSFELHVVS